MVNIFHSFKNLSGNQKVTIICQCFWGVPFGICNFYLSLYMKSQGVTDRQLGYLISFGFIFGIISSLFGGVIVDTLGRKRAMVISDIITWPLSFLIYALSSSYLMFLLGVFTNKLGGMVTSVAFNCIMSEDANKQQRMSAFNLINIINTTTGLLVPLGGIAVKNFGLVQSERSFLFIGAIIMTAMMLIRNKFYVESEIGKTVLAEARNKSLKSKLDFGLYGRTISVLKRKPEIFLTMCLFILFQIYVAIGSYASLYFVPYLTDSLKMDKSLISILGAVFASVTLLVSIFLNPILLHRFSNSKLMTAGFSLDIIAVLILIFAPDGNLPMVILHIVFYACGASILMPHLSSLIANVTQENERTGVYTLLNTMSSILASIVGVVSGYIFDFNQVLIYVLSLVILTACMTLVAVFRRVTGSKQGKSSGLTLS